MHNVLITPMDVLDEDTVKKLIAEGVKSHAGQVPVFEYQMEAKRGDYFSSFNAGQVHYCKILKVRAPAITVLINGDKKSRLNVGFIDGYLSKEQYRRAKEMGWPPAQDFGKVIGPDDRQWTQQALGWSWFKSWPNIEAGYDIVGYVKPVPPT